MSESRTRTTRRALSRSALGAAVASELGIDPGEGVRAVDAVVGVIARTVASGQAVVVANFGSWTPVERPERPGRNLWTGTEMTVPAQRTIRFRPASRLRRFVRACGMETGAATGKSLTTKAETA